MTLLRELGVAPSTLTILAIPHHEGKIAIDRHAPTVQFLRDLQDGGATLVMHGLTHRMARAWSRNGGSISTRSSRESFTSSSRWQVESSAGAR